MPLAMDVLKTISSCCLTERSCKHNVLWGSSVYKVVHFINCMTGSKEFFCIECKTFLTEEKFNKNGGRILCAYHDNKKRDHARMQNPATKKSKIIWHVARNDALKKFKVPSKISSTQVKEILTKHNIQQDLDVRLLPANPLLPLSPTNFCITSLSARKEIVSFWIRTHCFDAYSGYIGPDARRPVYGMCNDEIKLAAG
jgi:hypothetical protein